MFTKPRGPKKGCQTFVTDTPMDPEAGSKLVSKGVSLQTSDDRDNESTASIELAERLRNITGSANRGMTIYWLVHQLAQLPKLEVKICDLKSLFNLEKDATIRICNVLIEAGRMERTSLGKYRIILEKPSKSVWGQQLRKKREQRQMRKLSTGKSSVKCAVTNCTGTQSPNPQKGDSENFFSEAVLSGAVPPPKLPRYHTPMVQEED